MTESSKFIIIVTIESICYIYLQLAINANNFSKCDEIENKKPLAAKVYNKTTN